MNNLLKQKYRRLKKFLSDLGGGIIAFSGGIDSGLLCKIAHDTLKNNIIAVTAESPTYPRYELKDAKKIAKEIGVKHIILNTKEFKNKNFLNNSRERCYWCKKELFSKLKKLAKKNKLSYIMDGTNYEDRFDHRPGASAKREFEVISPLYEHRLTKKDIRILAKYLKISFWNKPQSACLSSRIPFGEKITLNRIRKIEQAEVILRQFLGTDTLFRARDHNDILRIEIESSGWQIFKKVNNDTLAKKLKRLGFKYITVDLEGYVPAGLR